MKNKLRSNSGSTMILAIFSVIIVSILGIYITNQIGNQLKSSKNTYEGIKLKYISEAGIEKCIYDIENQVLNKINNSNIDSNSKLESKKHGENDGCPKVYFDENGIPKIADGIWNGDGFANLIYWEIIDRKIGGKYEDMLYNNIRLIVGEEKAKELRNYYFNNIWSIINDIKVANNGLNYKHKEFENSINSFIGMIKNLEIEILNSNTGDKNKAIDGFNEMISYMEDIKCRLNMFNSEETNPPDLIDVHLPYYDVKLNKKNNTLEFIDLNNGNQEANIKNAVSITMDNGNILDMDFTNLNNEIQIKLIKSVSYNNEIRQEIQFYFDKNEESIKHNVISYDKK